MININKTLKEAILSEAQNAIQKSYKLSYKPVVGVNIYNVYNYNNSFENFRRCFDLEKLFDYFGVDKEDRENYLIADLSLGFEIEKGSYTDFIQLNADAIFLKNSHNLFYFKLIYPKESLGVFPFKCEFATDEYGRPL